MVLVTHRYLIHAVVSYVVRILARVYHVHVLVQAHEFDSDTPAFDIEPGTPTPGNFVVFEVSVSLGTVQYSTWNKNIYCTRITISTS